MSDKLAEIMAHKRQEIAPLLRPVFESDLATLDAKLPKPLSFAAALHRADGRLAVISEIKRRSPSAGAIAATADSAAQARKYRDAGADALSVLTDNKYFGGSLDDLRLVGREFAQQGPALPRLRKDFFIHPVQVAEAREAGASAILIIVRALDDEEIKALHGAARAAGLDALFEIHDEADLARSVAHGATIVGVNNRDLKIFKTDLGLTERLLPQVPDGIIKVSESGIFGAAEAGRAKRAGAHAILVGEALMKAPDTAAMLAEFHNA